MDIMQDLSVSSVTGNNNSSSSHAFEEDANHIFGIKGVIQQAGMILSPFSKRRRSSKPDFVPDTIQSFDDRDTDRDSPMTVDSSLEPSIPLTPTLEETAKVNHIHHKKNDSKITEEKKEKNVLRKELYVDDNDGKKELCDVCEKCTIL